MLNASNMDFRKTLILQLFLPILMFSANNYGCCAEAGWTPPSPRILSLQAFSTNQTLVVRWFANHSHPQEEGGRYEIQINRTNIVQSYNVSVRPLGGDGIHEWGWTSTLPLECADHSVRIRHFYNDSMSSSWNQYSTNKGQQPANTPGMFPKGVVLEGTSSMLCCIPTPGANITQISLRKVPYPLISIGDRVKATGELAKLTIPSGPFKFWMFICTDSKYGDKKYHIYPSIPPEKPRNLSCETSDLKKVTCRWDPGKEDHLLRENKRKQTLYIDPQNPGTSGGQYKCDKSSCEFAVVPRLEEYNISLLVSNPLGNQSARYSFNISDRVFPVVRFRHYDVRPGVREANVSWIVEKWLSPVDLLCEVTLNESSTEVRCGSVGGRCQVNVRSLLPNTLYYARVRCGLEGKTPGRWTQNVSFGTRPFVSLDLWRTISQFSNNIRNVTLIWKLHGSAGNTVIQIQSQEGENRTTRADEGQSQAEISIGPGQCEFTVQAALQIRFPIKAYITIPPVDAGEKPVAEQQVSFRHNLSWAAEDSATCGYMVEWCILGNVPCILQWMKLPKGNNSLLLNPGDFKDGNRYTFKIYGCTENGHKLLEIQTGYFLELTPVESLKSVNATSTSSSVTLKWHYNEKDHTHPGFIIGYLVIVQEVPTPGSPGQMLFNVSVSDPQQKWVIIGGLRENRTYKFHLSALTKKGSGPVTHYTFGTSSNFLVYWVKILTPLVLLLGCAILLCYQRKILKSRLKITFAFPDVMKIKPFELESFLQETGKKFDTQELDECVCCDVEIINTKQPPQ